MKRAYICGIGLAFLIAVIFFPIVAVGHPVTIQCQITAGNTCINDAITTGLDWDYIYAHPGEDHSWSLPSTIAIDLGGGDTAYIDGVDIGVGLVGDPYIDFGFSARAGRNSDTHFSFTSDVLSIDPALFNAEGYAATATTKLPAGATLAGDFTGNKVFRAEYNGGTVFADLSPAGVSDSVGDPTPISISGQVSSMQSMWGLTISKGGSANGSSDFTIVGDTIPEPATMALLGLGGLALIRKHRA